MHRNAITIASREGGLSLLSYVGNRFKERLIQAGASEAVFDAVNRQFSRHGYMARGGQTIDASIVQTPKQSIKKEEKE